MEEFVQKTSERLAIVIQQFLEKFDELPEDGVRKIGLLEGTIFEEEQIENKVQEAVEISAFESCWAIFERKLEERLQDLMGNSDQLEEQMEGKSAEVSLQFNGDLNDLKAQLGKICNIDFWVFRQNQLTKAIAVHLSKKIQNGGLQTAAGNLFLSVIRQRKRGAIVKKGMG